MASYFGNKILRGEVYFSNHRIKHICFNGATLLHTVIGSIPLDGFIPNIISLVVRDSSSQINSNDITLSTVVNLSDVNSEDGTAFLSSVSVQLVYTTVIPGSRDVTITLQIKEEDNVSTIDFVKTIEFKEGTTYYNITLSDNPIHISVGSKLKDYVEEIQVWGSSSVSEFESPEQDGSILNIKQVYNVTQTGNVLEVV